MIGWGRDKMAAQRDMIARYESGRSFLQFLDGVRDADVIIGHVHALLGEALAGERGQSAVALARLRACID